MAYIKPDGILQKFFNRVALLTGYGGSVALLVKGRKSGTWQKVPVIPMTFEGQRYLISVRGESEWVRNVRAAGGCQLQKGKRMEDTAGHRSTGRGATAHHYGLSQDGRTATCHR